jgi:hypothetical protein
MCKEMSVIPIDRAVDQKIVIEKQWRAEKEKRHKGLLTPKYNYYYYLKKHE